jgi:sirohydrochlorin ferrochelatase
MSQGWFVREKLPRVLEQHRFRDIERLPAFGLDPRLPDLIAERIAGLTLGPGERVVLVAHGSGSGEPASRLTTLALASDLARRLPGLVLEPAFIEEAPAFDSAIVELMPAAVIGLFASAGTHAVEDVAAAVATAPFVRHHILAIGQDAGAHDIVARAVGDCISTFSA